MKKKRKKGYRLKKDKIQAVPWTTTVFMFIMTLLLAYALYKNPHQWVLLGTICLCSLICFCSNFGMSIKEIYPIIDKFNGSKKEK